MKDIFSSLLLFYKKWQLKIKHFGNFSKYFLVALPGWICVRPVLSSSESSEERSEGFQYLVIWGKIWVLFKSIKRLV